MEFACLSLAIKTRAPLLPNHDLCENAIRSSGTLESGIFNTATQRTMDGPSSFSMRASGCALSEDRSGVNAWTTVKRTTAFSKRRAFLRQLCPKNEDAAGRADSHKVRLPRKIGHYGDLIYSKTEGPEQARAQKVCRGPSPAKCL